MARLPFAFLLLANWTGLLPDRSAPCPYNSSTAICLLNGVASWPGRGAAFFTMRRRVGPVDPSRAAQHRGTQLLLSSERTSMHLRLNRRLNRMQRARLAEMNRGDVVGIYLLPAIDMIEQLG